MGNKSSATSSLPPKPRMAGDKGLQSNEEQPGEAAARAMKLIQKGPRV